MLDTLAPSLARTKSFEASAAALGFISVKTHFPANSMSTVIMPVPKQLSHVIRTFSFCISTLTHLLAYVQLLNDEGYLTSTLETFCQQQISSSTIFWEEN